MKKIMMIALMTALFAGCKSIDLEKSKITNEFETEDTKLARELEEFINEEELEALIAMQGEEIEVDTTEATETEYPQNILIDENPKPQEEKIIGKQAAQESIKKATIKPEQYKNGTFLYSYNEDNVYEVYAQPYHLTDIVLEPGEAVIGSPLFSEDENVWELTAGVARDENGEEVQHLFIKPAYSGLDSSLIIITDRRVYHFRTISYKDTHMAIVKFKYPKAKNVWAKSIAQKIAESINPASNLSRLSNPEFLSFDYKITYSKYKVPEFLPTRVYDDGQVTYIQLNESVLQKELPLLFNGKTEITNYAVKKNVLVIPRLINTLTLRLGKQKVTITKKKQ